MIVYLHFVQTIILITRSPAVQMSYFESDWLLFSRIFFYDNGCMNVAYIDLLIHYTLIIFIMWKPCFSLKISKTQVFCYLLRTVKSIQVFMLSCLVVLRKLHSVPLLKSWVIKWEVSIIYEDPQCQTLKFFQSPVTLILWKTFNCSLAYIFTSTHLPFRPGLDLRPFYTWKKS